MTKSEPNQSPERKRRVVSELGTRDSGFGKQRRAESRIANRESRSGLRGFTLLEALVATAVLGAAVAALLGLLSVSLRNAARIEAPEQALLLGQSKLNELISAGVTGENPSSRPGGIRADGEASQTHALPFDQTVAGRWDERFRWEARATRFRSSPERTPEEVLLARITLDVFWRTANEQTERKLSFETYQLRREPNEGNRE